MVRKAKTLFFYHPTHPTLQGQGYKRRRSGVVSPIMENDFVFAKVKDTTPFHFLASVVASVFHGFFSLIFGLPKRKLHGLNCSTQDVHQHLSSWRVTASMLILHLLLLFRTPYALFGSTLEHVCNLISANNGILRTFFHLLTGSLKFPTPEYYRSFIGLLDSRWDIPQIALKRIQDPDDMDTDSQMEAAAIATALVDVPFLEETFPSAWSAQVSIMGAKLSYENPHFIKRVVEKRWKMHFVRFFSCWNEYLKFDTTQAYMFTDKEQDANAVFVVFRGTSPFENYDWATDVDFSWFNFPDVGKVHVGFLEALGVGDRRDLQTFHILKAFADKKAQGELHNSTSISGLSDEVKNDPNKELAYDAITSQLKEVLNAHPRAKLYIAGHSLGGALTALFSGLLVLENDPVIVPRIQGVVTFGQPRVGDGQFAEFMANHLCKPDCKKYVRVVYNFDLPARVPFDDPIFKFKHFGGCHYHFSRFLGEAMEEEPHRNYFTLLLLPSTYLACAWEIIEAIIFKYFSKYGETWLSIFSMRILGFWFPGGSAHNPANYVNAVFMGPRYLYHYGLHGEREKIGGGFFSGMKALLLQIRELRARRKKITALIRKKNKRRSLF